VAQPGEPTEAPRTAKPGTSLSQFWTIGTLTRDPRIQGRHFKVAWSIYNSNYQSRGAGQASLRYIQAATKQSIHTIMRAISELIDWGYLTRLEVGAGETPSSFSAPWTTEDPVWDIRHLKAGARSRKSASARAASSAAHACDTKADKITAADECSEPTAHACSANSDITAGMCIESGLSLTGLTGLKIKTEIESAAASPPRSPAAFAPDGADAAEEGFQKLWRTYGLFRKKAEAREAYKKLNDGVDLARVIEAATAWRKAWAAQGDPDAPRKYLHTWLAKECFDEEPPGRKFAKAEGKARKPTAKPAAPANDNKPAARTAWQWVEIVASEVIERPAGTALAATMRTKSGETTVDKITLEDASAKEQDAGQSQFSKLRTAVGVRDIDDPQELLFLPFERCVVGGKPQYRALVEKAAWPCDPRLAGGPPLRR
jgi:hypothetical protein